MKNILLILIFIPLIFTACKNSEKSQNDELIQQSGTVDLVDPDKLLAKVNDFEIHQKDLNGLPLDQAIDNLILYIEAEKEGLDEKFVNDEPRYKRAKVANLMRAKFLEEKYVEKKPTEEEIQEFYDSRPEKYTYLTIFKIFVIGDEEAANKIRNAAKEIQTFKKLENLEGQFKDEVTLLKVDLVGQKRLMAYKDILAPSVGYVSNPVPIEGMKNRYNIFVVAEVEKIDISNFKNAITHSLLAMDKNSQFKQMVAEFKEKNAIKVQKF